MARTTKKAVRQRTRSAPGPLRARVGMTLASLESAAQRRVRAEMSSRYGIHVEKAFGVPMAKMQALAKALGRDQQLAEALWKTGWYEARIVATLVAEPDRVTPALMERWCRDFDNWGIVDTACFKLFDQVPGAIAKVSAWARKKGEFQKRAAFALLACLALHDREPDAALRRCLPLALRAAADGRNFVWKGVSWALRSIGGRSLALHREVVAAAQDLAAADGPARVVGKDVLRDLQRPLVLRRLAR